MEEEKIDLPGGETPEEEVPVKSTFQIVKESWYDKVPLTLKQLDIIVAVCWILLALTGIAIALDAMGYL